MSLKKKLITSISALCLLIATMVVGVFAAGSVTYRMGSTVSFTASGVYVLIDNAALVDGFFTTTDGNGVETDLEDGVIPDNKLSDIVIDTTMDYDEEIKPQLAKWKDLLLNFTKGKTSTKITFDVTNTTPLIQELLQISVNEIKNVDKKIYIDVRITKTEDDGQVKYLLGTNRTETNEVITNAITLEQEEKAQMEVEITVVDDQVDVNLSDFLVDINMSPTTTNV